MLCAGFLTYLRDQRCFFSFNETAFCCTATALRAVLFSITRSPCQQQPVLAGGRKWPLPHLGPFHDRDAAHELEILAQQQRLE